MWLIPLLFCLLMTLGCQTSLNRSYFAALELLFEYTGRQLRQLLRRQAHMELVQVRRRVFTRNYDHQVRRTYHHRPDHQNSCDKSLLSQRMEECCDVLSAGLSLVLEDDVTPRFGTPPPPVGEWNLLTRTLRQHLVQFNWRLWTIWLCSFLLRYGILTPIRIVAGTMALSIMVLSTLLLGQLPSCTWKHKVVRFVLRQCFRLICCSLTLVCRYHNLQHRPRHGICVCNHTSPLDVVVLMSDGNYSITGQRHGGIIGMVQRALTRVSPHVWFERGVAKERKTLGSKMRLHVAQPDMPPILLFPEGTCINNTAVMQFKKGSFAISNIIHPVALTYDRRFGDAFWDSTRYSMSRYLIMVLSSWSILCDIWYMPALLRRHGESAIEFSNRVKKAIATQAGIDDLPWDGNLKRWNPVRDWQ